VAFVADRVFVNGLEKPLDASIRQSSSRALLSFDIKLAFYSATLVP
jgi:hypothetical protein